MTNPTMLSGPELVKAFNKLIEDNPHVPNIPSPVKRFTNKQTGIKRFFSLGVLIDANPKPVEKAIVKKAVKKAVKKPPTQKTKAPVKKAVEKKEVPKKSTEKPPKQKAKAKKESKPKKVVKQRAKANMKKVKKAGIKRCIVYKPNGDMSPVQTAYKIFDTHFKKLNLSRQEFIHICEKAGVKSATAARQWTGKLEEYLKDK